MNLKNIIPQSKEDLNFIKELKKYKVHEIKEAIPILLEWLQDGNWPQAKLISEYFSEYINDIDQNLIEILKGEDSLWKYWTLKLIVNSRKKPNDNLLETIKGLYNYPSNDDKEEEVDAIAAEILSKLNS